MEDTIEKVETEDTRPVVTVRGEERHVNLTPEQAGQIVFDGIYKADPEKFRDFEYISRYWDTSGKYHCRNWCFRVEVWSDGDVRFVDTYWSCSSDTCFRVNEENFDKMFPRFELVMDSKDNYRYVSGDEARKYDPSDIVEAAFDSGGWTYGKTRWLRKDAVPLARRELAQALGKARSGLRALLSTTDASCALRDLEAMIEKVRSQGLPLDDADDMASRDEFLSSLDMEETKLGFAAGGDFARWLEEDAYCPGEVYSPNGFTYLTFDAEDDVLKFADGTGSDGERRECFYVPSRESLVYVVSNQETGKAADAMHCDATEHNVRALLGFVKEGKDASLDEFAPWHGNGDAEKVVIKLERAIAAVGELRAVIGA